MESDLDLERWDRRLLFEFFRGYASPFFNVCAPVDVSALVALRGGRRFSYAIACYYLSMKVANEIPPFRYRLRGDRVAVHDRVHPGATVLVDDERFVFCAFDYHPEFAAFQAGAQEALARARAQADRLEPASERDDLIYHSILPWVAFTSISHAHRGTPADSVPRVSFGRRYEQQGRVLMPVSVEVHHALMDGLHVGRYFERFQSLCAAPATALGLGDGA